MPGSWSFGSSGLDQDDVHLGQHVAEDADDLELEALGCGAAEDGQAVALHPRFHLREWKDLGPLHGAGGGTLCIAVGGEGEGEGHGGRL
jgi:hypothetical protein